MKKLPHFLLFILALGYLIAEASVIASSNHKILQDSLKQAALHSRQLGIFSFQPIIINTFTSHSILPIADAIQYTRGSGTFQSQFLDEEGLLTLKRGYKDILRIRGIKDQQIRLKIIEDWMEWEQFI